MLTTSFENKQTIVENVFQNDAGSVLNVNICSKVQGHFSAKIRFSENREGTGANKNKRSSRLFSLLYIFFQS